jgi:hypothetical protein
MKEKRHKSYWSPRATVTVTECESPLLASSVYQRSAIETAGQENAGYFENGEIVSTDNYWGD